MIGLAPTELSTLHRVFMQFPEIEEVILFGSRAAGTHRPGSDVDLAIKGKNITINTLAKLKYTLEEETNLPYFFDVLDYGKIKNTDLIEQIQKGGDLIYPNWFTKLHNNLNGKDLDHEKIFLDHAKYLMNHYELRCGGKTFELCELEYYYFNAATHPDPYCHNHCLQLRSGGFYVHRLGGTRGGVDLTFGDGSYFGGILIRGLKQNEKCITGPNKCRKELSHEEADYSKIQEEANSWRVTKRANGAEFSILRSTRVGLSDSPCDKDFKYKTAFYRFIRKDGFGEQKTPEKTRVKLCSHPEIDAKGEKAAINELRQSKEGCSDYALWQKIKGSFES